MAEAAIRSHLRRDAVDDMRLRNVDGHLRSIRKTHKIYEIL